MRTVLLCIIAVWAVAVGVARAQNMAVDSRINAQLAQMQAEIDRLRNEVDSLRRTAPPSRLPPVQPDIALGDTDAGVTEVSYTTGELDAVDPSKWAWRKGDFKIVPYGTVTVSAVYETSRSVMGDFILYVPSRDTETEDAWFIDPKSTRLGLTATGPGPTICPASKVNGVVELDFQGQYVTRNKPGVLFRKAYVELKDEQFRLLAGQTWEIISPLYPGMLNYVPGSAGGNLGYRRSQIRLDRYLACSSCLLWTLQGSLNGHVLQDFATDSTVLGQPSGWPVVQARAAVTLGRRKGPGALPVTFGVSGHIGELVYDYFPPNLDPIDDTTHRTWSINADLKVPFSERCGVQCEFFSGENLSAFMGGVLQGIDPGTRDTIRSIGGWIDFWYDWTPRLHSHAGFSIDDPIDSDLTTGRRYNHFFFGNVVYDWSDSLMTGLEVSAWKTLWVDMRPGDTVRFEVTTKYRF